MGTGTTAEAALELGRNAIGYEINEEYKELINTKIKRASEKYEQMSLDSLLEVNEDDSEE